ncbi:hypothetical protein [Streptomyces sp. NPDC003023]|uniref:hypothetical protein n=1 Tax=Streptomyces sp. NPDC003023 TaxID=3364675 RepID=UPI0036A624A4
MSPADRTDAPIYADLVDERGDVPADARRTAEETLREISRVMDFSDVLAGR